MWLPEYNESLNYMSILFPMVLFESKMGLLINPYLKTFRKENSLLKINLLTVVFSLLLTLITVFFIGNINLAILSITFLLAFRSVVSEIYISKILKENFLSDILLELIMSIIFIFLSWNFNIKLAMPIYLITYIIYIIVKRKDALMVFKYLKDISKKELDN